jgi:hypothetical protein
VLFALVGLLASSESALWFVVNAVEVAQPLTVGLDGRRLGGGGFLLRHALARRGQALAPALSISERQ